MSSYDPMANGARCDVCPLRGSKPVPTDFPNDIERLAVLGDPKTDFIAIVGEAPGEQEVQAGRAFVGPSGDELNKGLRAAGIDRRKSLVTNVILCFPGETLVSAVGIRKVYRRLYQGPVVRIKTVSGNVLTGTPNHPALTPSGLVGLGELKEGSCLFRGTDLDGVGRRYPNVENEPTSIEEVYRSASESEIRHRVVGRSVDFHGDGVNGHVDVVLVDGELRLRCKPDRTQESNKECLTTSYLPLRPGERVGPVRLRLCDDIRSVEAATRPSYGTSFGCDATSFFDASGGHSSRQCLASASGLQAGAQESTSNKIFADAEIEGDLLDGAACLERFDSSSRSVESSLLSFQTKGVRFGSKVDSSTSQELLELRNAHTEFGCDLLERLPRKIALDYVISVEWLDFSGHVYNLETEGGWYFANNVAVSNCRPPDNKLKVFLDKVKKADKLKHKQALEKDPNAVLVETPSPVDCCKPRLERDIAGYTNFIALGKVANQAVSGATSGILAVRGGLVEVDAKVYNDNGNPVIGADNRHVYVQRRVMPTVHPAFVLRTPRWRHVFRNDLLKANKHFKGLAEWKPPEIVYNPTPDQLRAFLGAYPAYAFDTETDGIEPLTANLRCIGVGTQELVYVVGVESIDKSKRDYPPEVEAEIRQVFKEFLEDTNVLKIMHNASYDITVMKAQWGIESKNVHDTLLLHKSVESELPHNLGYVGSLYTMAPAWKTDRAGVKLAFGSETNEQLREYCAKDVSVTHEVYPPLYTQVGLRDQRSVWLIDQEMQKVCMEMHANGMYVDQAARQKKEVELLKARQLTLDSIRAFPGVPGGFNPGSIFQLRDLLFDQWELSPKLAEEDRYTASDDPSTDDLVLRTLLTDGSIPEDKRDFIKLLRRYRKLQKVLGTYVAKMRYTTLTITSELGWDTEDWIDLATRQKFGIERTGIVYPKTGRMHPGYNVLPVCVTPDTWLITEEGPRQIGTLNGFGPAGTERVASALSLHDGQGFNEVSHLQNPGVCLTKTVKAQLGISLTGTPHHRVQVAEEARFRRLRKIEGKKTWITTEPSWTWRRLDALQPGDYLRVPIGMDAWSSSLAPLPDFARTEPRTNATRITLPTEVTEDLAFFMGSYNSDGSLHDSNGSFGIRISLRGDGREKNKRSREEVLACAIRLFGEEAVRADVEAIHITSISLAPWCEALGFGRGAENKRIPPWVLASTKEVVLAYLRGLAHDSCVTIYKKGGTPCWKLTGVVGLLKEAQVLLLNLGLPAFLRSAQTSNSPNTWEVRLFGYDDVSRVCGITGQAIPPCRGKSGHRKFIQRGNTLWLKVQSVEDAGSVPVLDVTVPEGHAFWANGTVSHNTGRLSSSKPINCFDAETEVLTERGWVKFPDSKGEKVAQWWPDGNIDFVAPSTFHEGTYEGQMVCLENLSNSLRVTDNHRLLLWKGKQDKGDIVVTSAQSLYESQATRRTGWYQNTWTIHAGLYKGGPGLNLKADEIRLLVAMQADGSWVHGRGLDFGFAKQRKQERIEALFASLGIPYKVRDVKERRFKSKGDDVERTAKARKRYTVLPSDTPEFLSEYLGKDKLWGPWLLQMSRHQMDVFKEEIWHWDGHLRLKSQYASSIKQNADWVSAILALSGVTAKVRYYENKDGGHVYSVDAVHRNKKGLSPKSELRLDEWKSETVYSVTVPSSFLVVRRNGRVSVTGQSQNYPKDLRSLVIAAPGNVLVGADADQLELRIAAAHWGVELYLRAFTEGKDPHSMTAFAVFGEAFTKAAGLDPNQFKHQGPLVGAAFTDGVFDKEKASKEAVELRNLSKAVQYASQYMGSVETVHELIQKTEIAAIDKATGKPRNDGTTDLPYATMPLRKVRAMREKWLSGAPEFESGWEREIELYKSYGFLKDPVHGRRRDFLDGEDPNQIVNFEIQSAAAGLMNNAIINLFSEVQKRRVAKNWGPHCGIINQCHDSIVLEVPEAEAEWAAKTLEGCMNQTHPSLPGVVFSATAVIGKTWKQVG